MTRPLISIVSGTFQRLESLKTMINSVRASIPTGIGVQFVIVDGGSRDGTQAYLAQYPDCVLIQHEKLLGAIRAFTDGAKAATGRYVLLSNDDIEFTRRDSIMRAVAYLESHVYCGAIAFADDRPAQGYGEGFKIQNMRALREDGTPGVVPYAQVGLFRKELGDHIGWWGADDPCMGQTAGTYGGDNWLSAKIWEMGYTVDPVAKVVCHDVRISDALREMNEMKEESDPGGYYRCYPNGPIVPNEPKHPAFDDPPMRILYMPIYEPAPPVIKARGTPFPLQVTQKRNKRGLRQALSKIGSVWEIDYVNSQFDLPEIVSIWQPDILFMQVQGIKEMTPQILAEARRRCPEMAVFNWNGDAHLNPLVGNAMLDFLNLVDLQLVVNAHVLPTYAAEHIRAAYWQIGYEKPADPLPDVPYFDVVFQGNCYSQARKEMETALRAIPNLSVGIYGSGWQQSEGNSLYDFAMGEAIYKRSTISIGDHYDLDHNIAYMSNRVVQALGAGSFMLLQETPGLEKYTGLRDGIHYVSWKNTTDLKKKVVAWMKPGKKTQREAIAAAGYQHIHQVFTFDALVTQLFTEIIPNALGEKQT